MAGIGKSFGRGRGKKLAAAAALGGLGTDSWKDADVWGSTNAAGTAPTNEELWGAGSAKNGASNSAWDNNTGNGAANAWEGDNGTSGGWQADESNSYSNGGRSDRGRDRPSNGGSRACHKCGEEGHFARECSQGGGGGGSRACHKCGEEGHIARECPQGGGGGGSRACHKCGEEGHFARECPQGGGGGGSRACHKCGEEGHIARECPQGGGGGGSRACHKCGEEGHIARECPQGGGGNRACHKCGEEGHIARECPQGGGGGGGGGERECYKCKKTGHISRDCPEPAPEGDASKPAAATHTFVEIEDEQEMFKHRLETGINFENYDKIPVNVTGQPPIPEPIQSFNQAGLTETVLHNVTNRMKYAKPTPVQKHAIPVVNAGRDVMGCAQTGSGKTAAFMLPILSGMFRNSLKPRNDDGIPTPQALIISPVRELTKQIYEEARKFAWGTVIRPVVAYGGTAMSFQLSMISKGCNVLIATPGRLNDIINRGAVSLEHIEFLVLDEADRMLDMGFSKDVEAVVKQLPAKTARQTLMFSATFPGEIQKMAANYLNNYVFIAVGQVGHANADVTQTIIEVESKEKTQKLVELLTENPSDRVLVFVEMKRRADYLAAYLSQCKFPTTSIHGDRLQKERETALMDFTSGVTPIMVATSVAARGLDIPDVKHVVNYDLPKEVDEYVHRIGRTGRAGNTGRATSFFNREKDEALARPLVKILAGAQQVVPDFLENMGMSGAGYGFHTETGGVDQRGGADNWNQGAANSNFGGGEDEEW